MIRMPRSWQCCRSAAHWSKNWNCANFRLRIASAHCLRARASAVGRRRARSRSHSGQARPPCASLSAAKSA